MPRSREYRIFVSFVLPILIAGCVTPAGYDYTALENSRPRSILVIPPTNNSIEVNAPYIYLASVSRPLAEKGYYVFPVAVIDSFLKENGLPTPAEMNAIPLDKIEEVFGADAVLFASIEDWGQKYQLVTSVTTVHAELRLVDTRTGKLLWETTVKGAESSDDANAGLLGAIVNAVATQISRSISDESATYRVSSYASYAAIHNRSNGLLHGPYFNPDGVLAWNRPKAGGDSAKIAVLENEVELLHVGKAASEIVQQTYHQELWSRSLELAKGNEEKRKGIYVKLRAKQLAEEKAKSEKLAMLANETAQSHELMVNVSGSYIAEITISGNAAGSKSFLEQKDRKKIMLKQSGNKITGTDGSKTLKINGTREGNTIKFHVLRGNQIDGSWKINADASRLQGEWNTDGQGGASGKWNLTRIGPPAGIIENKSASNSTSGVQPEKHFDLSGTYVSDITTNNNWRFRKAADRRLKITISQNGNEITGTNNSKNLKINGVIDGDEISFFTWPSDISSDEIKGKWKIDSDGNRLTGKWSHPHGGGKWNLTRVE